MSMGKVKGECHPDTPADSVHCRAIVARLVISVMRRPKSLPETINRSTGMHRSKQTIVQRKEEKEKRIASSALTSRYLADVALANCREIGFEIYLNLPPEFLADPVIFDVAIREPIYLQGFACQFEVL
jgi:hypothetical protein